MSLKFKSYENFVVTLYISMFVFIFDQFPLHVWKMKWNCFEKKNLMVFLLFLTLFSPFFA